MSTSGVRIQVWHVSHPPQPRETPVGSCVECKIERAPFAPGSSSTWIKWNFFPSIGSAHVPLPKRLVLLLLSMTITSKLRYSKLFRRFKFNTSQALAIGGTWIDTNGSRGTDRCSARVHVRGRVQRLRQTTSYCSNICNTPM